ncbi:hypothetical protein CN367_11850 [Priestia megaterium]|uniref:hypothetical protein n=1 Tax=Priestia megaterium TaxID=1404 RepID=UPI000BFAA627|nr:hypothetical protein [Priestia megaterium]PEZ47053.1 hypothetical protein CN367_11850 [Priestia megaterium]
MRPIKRHFGGLTISVEGNLIVFKKGLRKKFIMLNEAWNVGYEKRLFTGHTLVIQTPYKILKFGFMSQRQVMRAIDYLLGLYK